MANLATYSNIIADIKDKFSKNSSGFGSETDTSIRKWISQKEFDIYASRKWPFMRKSNTISTVASTQSYSLATDYAFGSLYDVIDSTNKIRLYRANAEDIDTYYAGLSTSSTPTYYFLDGVDTSNVQKISFYPIPADVYTITYRYYRDPTPTDISTDNSNDSLSPIIPQRYRSLLVDAVLEELLQKDANPNADRVNIKYQNMLQKMIMDYAEEHDFSPIRRSADERIQGVWPARLPSNYPRI